MHIFRNKEVLVLTDPTVVKAKLLLSAVVQSMEKLAGNLLLGLKFVGLKILSTSFRVFLYKLGELGSIKFSFIHSFIHSFIQYWHTIIAESALPSFLLVFGGI